MRSLGIYSLGALLGAGLARANAPPAKPCATGAFSGVLPPEATVLSAVSVPAGGSYGEGPADIAYPINPTNLPELCALIVNVSSSASSSFRFGVFLPADWNERMLTIGNGGFAGGINWLEMGTGVKYGHAVVSTDTGHNSTAGDNEWALRAEEKRKDFGYRAIHGSVAIGKKIVAAYYGKGIAFSYYSGGSTGGRQGLKELQLHADSFDGALIGAPAWWTKRLQPWTTRAAIWNLPVGSPNHVPVELFKVLEAEVLRQCDAADGVADGIVSAPEACSFDFSALACKASGTENASSCFTEAQIETMRHIYAPYTIGDELVFPGAELSSESQMPFLFGGSAPSSYGDGYIRNFVLDDPDWTWQQYNDSLIALSDARDAGGCTADGFAAMKQFARAGGKLVLYHGLADALIPPGSARVLRDKIRAAMRAACQETDSWFRFFLVPGMQHVQGTAVGAPWYFGGSGQAAGLTAGKGGAPGDVVAGLGELGLRDAKHDLMLAMMEWVEKGRPIDEMVATSWNVERDVTSGVLRQRVLCSEPKKQVFIGGDEKKLENWKCE